MMSLCSQAFVLQIGRGYAVILFIRKQTSTDHNANYSTAGEILTILEKDSLWAQYWVVSLNKEELCAC